MLDGTVFYHGVIRKCMIGFGRFFSNVHIDRKLTDPVKGETIQRLHVPLSYAPKEKWLSRLDEDQTLENHTLTTLPRMSFEIIAYTYDSLRKMNRMEHMKNVVTADDGGKSASLVRTPVPYNIDMSLYIVTKTQEDALQILEQVLPQFTPEYTISISSVEEMGINMDIPIVLNSVIVSDEYEGTFQERRFVIHTINFQMKISLFGAVTDKSIISKVVADVTAGMPTEDISVARTHTAEGDPITETITKDEWKDEFGA